MCTCTQPPFGSLGIWTDISKGLVCRQINGRVEDGVLGRGNSVWESPAHQFSFHTFNDSNGSWFLGGFSLFNFLAALGRAGVECSLHNYGSWEILARPLQAGRCFNWESSVLGLVFTSPLWILEQVSKSLWASGLFCCSVK